VLSGGALHREAEAGDDLRERRVDLRALRHHRRSVGGPDVVDIDVDGQPRQVEEKQVERRPALQRQARAEERVRGHQVEEPDEHPHLLERVDRETGLAGSARQLVTRQHQATSAQLWLRTDSGTMRFHR